MGNAMKASAARKRDDFIMTNSCLMGWGSALAPCVD